MTFVGGIVWSHRKKTTTIVVARILEMITHLENYDGIPEKSNLTLTSRYWNCCRNTLDNREYVSSQTHRKSPRKTRCHWPVPLIGLVNRRGAGSPNWRWSQCAFWPGWALFFKEKKLGKYSNSSNNMEKCELAGFSTLRHAHVGVHLLCFWVGRKGIGWPEIMNDDNHFQSPWNVLHRCTMIVGKPLQAFLG